MIAKIIVHGATRDTALARLLAALEATEVAGSVTNAAFLAALCRHAAFARGDVDTGLIDRDLAALIADEPVPEAALALAALAALGLTAPKTGTDPWDRLAGWRMWSAARQYALLESRGERIEVEVHTLGDRRFQVHLAPAPAVVELAAIDADGITFDIAGHRQRARVVQDAKALTVFLAGRAHDFVLPDRLSAEEENEAAGDRLVAPMPGLVKVLSAAAGDAVSRGQRLVILEAMKMEHTLVAPRDGTVAEVFVAAGEQVQDGAVLLRLEEEPHAS